MEKKLPRPALDPQTVSLIEQKWVHMNEPTAAEVHRVIRQEKGDVVAVRTVQKIIADLKKRRGEEVSNVAKPWEPWQSDLETAEEIDYLLELRRCGEIAGAGQLSITQAEWAKRIRVSMKEMTHPMVPFLVSALYAGRQDFSILTGRPEAFYTDDLDQYLAYKPWVSTSRRDIYDEGLRSGRIDYPKPFFLGNAFEELSLESRLRMVKVFGLPERCAHFTLDDLASGSDMPHNDYKYLFNMVGLYGQEAIAPYIDSLINYSKIQIQDEEAGK
tara:strand:+ start:45 stop:860 length:816 start_codon:yes stop_codon:yes gene_type:complete